MNCAELNGKRLAVITVELNEDGEEEGAVWTGCARWEGGCLFLDREGEDPFLFPAEIIETIKPAPAEVSRFFGEADYFVTLPLAPPPTEADLAESDGSDVDWSE